MIDPRTLAPLDMSTILESVSRTKHLIVAEQGRRTCGLAAEISAVVVEQAWDVLAAPPLRLTWPDVPVPYTPTLELACLVGTEDIVQGVRRVTQFSNARV